MNNSKITLFTDLIVWRRAASSITSNIAEGFGRQTYKEKVQFYYLASGSLTELKNQLFIARDVGYLQPQSYNELNDQLETTHKLLNAFITKTKSFITNSKIKTNSKI